MGFTDADGNLEAELTIPSAGATTRPLTAQVFVRLVDTNGRPVQRSLTRPVLADVDRIGIKPRFDEYAGLDEGSSAGFDIITVAPAGGLVARDGLNWTLSRIETTYQWYRDGSVEVGAITTTREVANGTVDTKADGPAAISAPVNWNRACSKSRAVGRARPLPATSSCRLLLRRALDTPDTLQVALIAGLSRRRHGAEARSPVRGHGAGDEVDDRIIDMQAVEVPADGRRCRCRSPRNEAGRLCDGRALPPSDAAEKRMPARALSLAFADVDPGDRKLDVVLDVAREMGRARHVGHRQGAERKGG